MSHFAIAVFTDDADPLDTVERALAPYHEYECTGTDDEYVQDVDVTEDQRAEYLEYKRSMVRLADGTLVSAYDPSMWRELTLEEKAEFDGKRVFDRRTLANGLQITEDRWGTEVYHPRVRNYPEGSEEVEILAPEIMTFLEFVEYWTDYKVRGSVPAAETKYGWIELDEKGEVARVVRRTNPNAKWDWYSIGGRYSERLFVKPGASSNTRGERSWGMEHIPDVGGTDSALLVDLDWERMTKKKREDRRGYFQEEYAKYLLALEAANGDPDEIAKVNSRAKYWWGWDAETMQTEDDFVGAVQPLTAFAALYRAKWYETGKMGWFAMVADEKDPDAWEREFQAILEDAAKTRTMRITIVDCHV